MSFEHIRSLKFYTMWNKRYSIIDQHLARHFKNNARCGSFESLSLSMQSNNYPFLSFNALRQSGKRVVILSNCRIPIPLFYVVLSLNFFLWNIPNSIWNFKLVTPNNIFGMLNTLKFSYFSTTLILRSPDIHTTPWIRHCTVDRYSLLWWYTTL